MTRAIRGKRGQILLRQLETALLAMPNKRLISGAFERDGEVCALGCLGKAKGMQLENVDPYDPSQVANAFGIADALAREIMFINDERYNDWQPMTSEDRYQFVLDWVQEQIKEGKEDQRRYEDGHEYEPRNEEGKP